MPDLLLIYILRHKKCISRVYIISELCRGVLHTPDNRRLERMQYAPTTITQQSVNDLNHPMFFHFLPKGK